MRVVTGIIAAVLLASSPVWANPERVWVAPFREVNESMPPDWVNRAIQQALSDELAALPTVDVVQPTNTSAATAPQAPNDQAKTLGARYVVSGTIQRVNDELRVTGRVQDTSNGASIGGFKATGSSRELFAIEDSIAQQLGNLLAPPTPLAYAAPVAAAPPSAPSATAPAPAAPAGPASSVTRIETPFAPGIYSPFDGSDLQASMNSRGPLRRDPIYVPYDTTPTYPQYPTYPVTYGLNGYNGYGGPFGYSNGAYWGGIYGGYGFNTWPSVVIIRNGDGGHHHGHWNGNWNGNWNGGGGWAGNGQAIRNVSGWGTRQIPPGIINTISGQSAARAPGVVNTLGGPGTRTGGSGGGGGGGSGMRGGMRGR